MSASQRRKGRAGEQELVNLARSYGLSAERTWQTAQSRDPKVRAQDVTVEGRSAQVKRVARLPRFLKELEYVDEFYIREDSGAWFVVLNASDWWRVLESTQGLDRGE